jgi:hypothetical protein
MRKPVHIVGPFLLLGAAAASSAEPIYGCAPALGPKDTRARQIAVLNAITTDLRAQGSPETAGTSRLVDDKHRLEVSSIVSAKLKNATVRREQFQRDDDGKNPRICVEVVVAEPDPAKR